VGITVKKTLHNSFYTYLNGNVKAEVFESVWMFAGAIADEFLGK